ncbi:MAG: nodulation protein NfeD [Dehalococcoidia bacterium]|nr:MAG: nodulation protein NfeD [Dehalococcoidia bacterium]
MSSGNLKLAKLAFLLLALLVASTGAARADSPVITVLTVKGTINPVLTDYLARGLGQAERDGAVLAIIQLDTPGGLDNAMRDIVQNIVGSRVPVAVYVSPSGARAASAGVFITLSGHIAAMAPNTVIGAASPVAIGPEGEIQMSETMQEKVLNDTAAYIRSLAASRERNLEWAERAVREAVSATEQEALEIGVIDLVAASPQELAERVSGREITMLDGRKITLDTRDAVFKSVDMSTAENFLYAISDPNIAFLLMGLAMLGLFVEITNPGLIFPGVLGAISLVLALFSLGTLPVNLAGILLIVLAFGFFIAEVFTTTFGLFTAGGVVSLIFGALILFKDGGPLFSISPWLIATVVSVITASFIFIIYKIVAARRKPAFTGPEELAGATAVVKTTLNPVGTVLFRGEIWTAVSESGTIEPEEEVTITRHENLKLWVARKNRGGSQ